MSANELPLPPFEPVLVVDDSEILVEAVVAGLEDDGWRVLTANSLAAATAVARQTRLSAAICDLHMPDASGTDVMRALRGIDSTIPVVILSGDGELEAVLRTVREGAFDFVQKSQDFGPLRAAVRRAASNSRVLRENLRLQDELRAANRALDDRNHQLELASAHKSEFLANMSHELRTPMNSIIGFTDLVLARGKGIDDKARRNLEKVLTNARHLLGLINDILDLSKVEAGRMELRVDDDVQLTGVVESAMQSAEVLLKGKPVTLRMTIAADVPRIRADRTRLLQVVMNLVSNACKFTQEGSVEVKVTRDGNFVAIAVADTGIGIAPEHHETIFEEFRQVDGSATRSQQGTGLGLAIVRRMVGLMHGTIGVKSEHGRGSVFTVRIPIDARVHENETATNRVRSNDAP